jgi:hypothetical protein
MIRLVCIDVDGTLVGSSSGLVEALALAAGDGYRVGRIG